MATERMYDLAFQYKRTKLWKKVFESELFAVKFSDGETGYCSVMGRLGEDKGIAVYVGEAGFQNLRTIMTFTEDGNMIPDYNEQLLSQDCMRCVFDKRDALRFYEQMEVRDYSYEHDIRLGGANAFPHFLLCKPCRFPWSITSKLDCKRICEVLEAGIFLSELLKTASKDDVGLVMMHTGPESIPMLEKQAGGFGLGSTPVPPDVPVSYPAPKLSNDLTVARLRKLKKKGTLQCAVVRMPDAVQEDEDVAPYYDVALVVVDEETEMLLPPAPVMFFEEHPGKLVDAFAETLFDNEIRPVQIKVGDERTLALLENFCNSVEIKLKKVGWDELALLDHAKHNFLYGMPQRGDASDGEDEADPSRIFSMIMMLSDDDLRKMPKAIFKQLLTYSDIMPPEVEGRLRRLLNL